MVPKDFLAGIVMAKTMNPDNLETQINVEPSDMDNPDALPDVSNDVPAPLSMD